jgi:hypothetical protein
VTFPCGTHIFNNRVKKGIINEAKWSELKGFEA